MLSNDFVFWTLALLWITAPITVPFLTFIAIVALGSKFATTFYPQRKR